MELKIEHIEQPKEWNISYKKNGFDIIIPDGIGLTEAAQAFINEANRILGK